MDLLCTTENIEFMNEYLMIEEHIGLCFEWWNKYMKGNISWELIFPLEKYNLEFYKEEIRTVVIEAVGQKSRDLL